MDQCQGRTDKEDKHRILFESSMDAILMLHPQKGYLDCNPIALEMFGVPSKEEFLKLTPIQLSPKFQPNGSPSEEKAAIHIKRALKDGNHVFEWLHSRLNGDTFHALVQAVRIEYDGDIILQGTIRDISQNKEAEEKLRRSEEFQRALIKATPDYIFVLDSHMVVINVNRIHPQHSKADVLGKSILSFIPPLFHHPFAAAFYRATDTSEIQTVETSVNLPDGEHFFLNRLNALKLPNQKGQVILVSTDITKRRKMEQELANAQKYISNIIDSMSSIIVGVDEYGIVTHWNKKTAEITGLHRVEVLGKPIESVLPRANVDSAAIIESIASREVLHLPKQVSTVNGKTRYDEVTVYPLIAGGLNGAVIRVDDITPRIHMEEMMIQTEKMMSVGGLAAGMAHEINNPLAGIIQTTKVIITRLLEQGDANQQAALEAGTTLDTISRFMEIRQIPRMLHNLQKSGMRAAEIVSNMLTFARKGDTSFTFCNIAELLDKTVNLAATDYNLEREYDFRQIKIKRHYKPVPNVYCERGKIQQVFLNILKNGAEAMHINTLKSGPSPEFSLKIYEQTSPHEIIVQIADNGPGMEENTRKRIFEPFFTTKSVGVGTGLGLFVSYFIVTQHHKGKMNVTSTAQKGTVFTIALPVIDAE